jgi:dTDP-4-dehydrorhamnose reductase
MLGHQLMYSLGGSHELKCTLRRQASEYALLEFFNESNTFFESDIRHIEKMEAVIDAFRPDIVVNCVGIVKQRPESEESIISIEINALAPHKVAKLCKAKGARFIHVSTDCVFDGRTGGYTESDPCNVSDMYGLTKYLGEVRESPAITLRTSIVGHELTRKTGLLEWFLSQKGQVKGFKKAIYSGVTTNELANVIEMLATNYVDASGLFHLASDPISKYDLLCLFKDAYARDVSVEPDDSFECDRSLNSDLFRESFSYVPPDWPSMVQVMRDEFKDRSNEL